MILGLHLLALLGPAFADDLLPETPEGWRYERIDFPLSFAPELEYEGFEELRFAPGMFAPGADSYFSYALAIRIEGDQRVDGAFAAEFLDTYYRGLARTVAAGRGLDLEGAAFGVEVAPHPAGFLATVDTVDAFVTGEALRLRFELSVHDGPGYVELFGIVSPLDEDAPIWDELHAIQERWRAARAAPVYLNHLYVVPDLETYSALASSQALRELIVVEERTTVRPDLTYTGVYLYGRDTYFEFLQPSDAFAPGSSGVGFGVEVPGATDQVMAALAERGVGTSGRGVSRELAGEQVPWFRMMGVQAAHADSRLSLFMLEYVPAFLRSWHTELPPEPVGIARAGVLERYAHSLGQGDLHREALLEDVTAVHLALDAREQAHLREVCDALGFVIAEGEAGWTAQGPRYRLVVDDAQAPGGVTRIDLALRREVEREPLVLGRVRLVFDGRRASLFFVE